MYDSPDAVNDRVTVDDKRSHIPRYLVPFRGKYGFDLVGAFAVIRVLHDLLANKSRRNGAGRRLADARDIILVLEGLEFGRPRINKLATTACTK